MRIATSFIAALFLLASFSFGCRPSQQDLKTMEQARTLLREAGVDPSTLEKRDEDMTIVYDAAKAAGSSDIMLKDWGAIFGILQWYAKDDVHIIISIENKPVAKVKADIDNIRKFSKGEMTKDQFFLKISFSVIS